MTEATDARDRALWQVQQGAPGAWLALARLTVEELAATGRPFNSDDIWARIGQPDEPRALGAVIRHAADNGTIVATGQYRKSARPANHARPIATWIGSPEFVDAQRPVTLF